MNTVAIKLGLAGDVSEEIILAEVSRLLNRVTDLIPHEEENKSLRDRLGAIDLARVGLPAGHRITSRVALPCLRLRRCADSDEAARL